ncbi:hypothetical protein [Sulfurimonas sp.]|uniref:hypothetical protein n=1 Tax=Sulfurimonas sp. TaxID=2022749 RepID=UPI003D0B91F4
MKRVIFLLFVLKSFLFSGTCYNSATDKITVSSTATGQCKETTEPVDVVVHSNCDGNYAEMYTSPAYTNSCTDVRYVQKTKYTHIIYLVDRNYQCPSGQEIINGACAVPPTCTAPQIWNSDTDTCVSPPAPDADGDGTPDKCDFDHPDFKLLDCDGDGNKNSSDPDLDGDGTDDVNDADMNNDGIPDANQPASPNYNPNCEGADLSRDYVFTGVTYPKATYYLKGNIFITQCISLVDFETIDSSFTAYDKNPQCNATYCYVHILKPDCFDESAKYIPQGPEWIYKSGFQSESQCAAMVDNIKYSTHSYSAPNLTNCPDSKYCYLKRVENVPDINNTTSENIDTNRTSSDLVPLLEAHNKSNEHLTDIKTKIDTTNTKLDDLKGISNEILNKNESMDSSLKSLKSNSDKSLTNDLEMLSSLSTISNATQKGNDINKAFSDVSTQNQVIGNGHLSDISGKMTTNNSLLTSIDNSLKGDGTSPDTSSLDGAESALTDYDGFIGNITSQFSTFKDNIQGNLDDVMNQYNNTKSLLTSGQAPTMSGGGSLECASFNMLGKHIVLDLSVLSIISPIVYYLFTSFFMVLNFSFLLNHLFRSGD